MKEEFYSPAWVSRTIEIIGIAIGALYVFAGIFYCVEPTFIPVGIGYIIGGAALLAMGIYGLVKSTSDERKMARTSLFMGAGYCAIEAVIAIFVGIVTANAYSQNQGYIFLILYLLVAAVFISAIILCLLASSRIKNDRPFKGLGMAGSIIFIVCEGANFILLIAGGTTNVLSYILSASLVVMAVFLLLVALKSEYRAAPSPIMSEPSLSSEPLDEEKKIRLIKEYKALLDQGIITEEEYEKKKRELL